MNKHELKSLLENIYRTLTQEGIIPPPSLGTGSKQWPTQSPDVAPPPPKPKPKPEPRLSEPEPYVRPVFPVTGRDWTVPYGPDDPNNPFGHTFQGRIDAIRHGRTYIPAPWYLQGTMAEAMNKQELKSLLENIYHLLAEAPGENEYKPDPNFVGPPHLNPPYIPDISDRRNPGHQPAPKPPPMPLDKNGNPQFPSQRFWEQLWRAQRRVPPGGTQNDYPNEFAEILRLDSILRAWEQQQQQQPPDDGGTLG